MQENDKIELAVITNSVTITTAVEGSKLITLKREMGMANLIKSLMVLIWDTVNWYALAEGKKMGEEQVIQLAQMLIEDYKYYSLEDFALAFKEGKKGKYGKHYNAIDGSLILGWLKLYDIDRDEVLARLNTFETPKEPILPDFVVENLFEKFALPIIEKEKFNEEEYRKFKISRLQNDI